MPLEYRFSCPLHNGLHARPASLLAELASRFDASVSLCSESSGERADASSVLDLVAAGFGHGETCLLRVEGRQEALAYAALVEFISSVLPGSDSPLDRQLTEVNRAASLPHALRGLVDNWISGIPAGPGQVLAPIRLAGGVHLPEHPGNQHPQSPALELERFRQARESVLQRQEEHLALCIGKMESQIQQAMLSLARDSSLQQTIAGLISDGGQSAAEAVVSAIRRYSRRLAESDSTYLQERRGDLEDIGLQLLEEITGEELRGRPLELAEDSIVCAPSLSTSTMLALDKSLLKGLVLTESGLNSHAVILARSHGIPVVVGVTDQSQLQEGTPLYLNGSRGVLVSDPSPAVQRFLAREEQRMQLLTGRTRALATKHGGTADGLPLEVAANIASPDEIDMIAEYGAEGIGLFRTEMLFSAYPQMPSEEQQLAIYSQLATTLGSQRLIIRTLDIGGDKPLPWLELPREDNPFLGMRGIRLYREHPELLRIQLRAILRAAVSGNIWLMAPMVTGVDDARWFREQVEAAHAELLRQGQPVGEIPWVGCMLEVPSAALQVAALSAHCDFFSIGSNDLGQYTQAMDRGHSQLSAQYNELHPGLLRLFKLACDDARAQGRWIGMCGEFAGKPLHAPLLAGLGLDEVSMSAPAIPELKQALATCDTEQARQLLDCCVEAADADVVLQQLAAFRSGSNSAGLLSGQLVNIGSDSLSRAEAIRELCGLCQLDGRCQDIDALEDSVWNREETYSTGLGHGIAIPHCRSTHINSASLAMLRLNTPVDWKALDGQPVDTVLLLAMPDTGDGKQHLRVFARLARRLMNDDFRGGLRAARTADNIVEFLERELVPSEE